MPNNLFNLPDEQQQIRINKNIKDINVFNTDDGEKKEINYCPYCGEKLVNKDNKLFCERCNEEIGFIANSAEYNTDEFEDMLIERKGKRYGLYNLIPATIFTVLSLAFITITMISTVSNGEGQLPYALTIGTTLIGYVGVIGDIVCLIIATINGIKVKKRGFKRIGTFLASFWVSLVGFAYGFMFIMILLVNTLKA